MSAEKLALADEREQLTREMRDGYTKGSKKQNDADYLLGEIRLKVLDKLIGRL